MPKKYKKLVLNTDGPLREVQFTSPFRSHFTSKKPKDGVFVAKFFSKLLILGLISKRLSKKIEKNWDNVCDSQRQSIVWRIVLFHNSAYA